MAEWRRVLADPIEHRRLLQLQIHEILSAQCKLDEERESIESDIRTESRRTLELLTERISWDAFRFETALKRHEQSLKQLKSRLDRIIERKKYNKDAKEAIEIRINLMVETERAQERREERGRPLGRLRTAATARVEARFGQEPDQGMKALFQAHLEAQEGATFGDVEATACAAEATKALESGQTDNRAATERFDIETKATENTRVLRDVLSTIYH